MSFARYGLEENPFGGSLLDPLDSPAKLSYYVTVEGFAEKRPELDKWANTTIAKPQFFLICGPPRTGRTSIANYIADKMPKDAGKEHLKVTLRVSDDDHLGAMHKWMFELGEAARRVKIEFTADLKSRFEAQIVGRETPFSNPGMYKSLLYDVINEIKHKRRVTAIFDNVSNSRIFTIAKEVFAPPDPHLDVTLVVFTTKDETLRKDFIAVNPSADGLPLVNLRHLTGQDAVDLIRQRWEQFIPQKPPIDPPFDEDAVKHIFDNRKYPIRDVIRALEYIISKKVNSLARGGNWPADKTLKIEPMELVYSFVEAEGKFLS